MSHRRQFAPVPPTRSFGFTLLEVLVTLIVISIGLLSIAQLQARALQFSYASLQRSVAIVQVNDLVERMWTGICDSETDIATIVNDWAETSNEHRLLPDWNIDNSDFTDAPLYTVVISWSEERIAPDRPELSFTFQLIDPDIGC